MMTRRGLFAAIAAAVAGTARAARALGIAPKPEDVGISMRFISRYDSTKDRRLDSINAWFCYGRESPFVPRRKIGDTITCRRPTRFLATPSSLPNPPAGHRCP